MQQQNRSATNYRSFFSKQKTIIKSLLCGRTNWLDDAGRSSSQRTDSPAYVIAMLMDANWPHE